MGKHIQAQKEWTKKDAKETKKLALQEATFRQELAESGHFSSENRTCDVEQEVIVVDSFTGETVNVSPIFDKIPGTRPDTTNFILEFDANGITPLTEQGIISLYESLSGRIKTIQNEVRKFSNNAVLSHIGLHPFITDKEARAELVIKNKNARYMLMDARTYHENPIKEYKIKNFFGETIKGQASNLSAMSRCAGTQFHISERTVEAAVKTHNISIAIAGPMIALFGNSPFMEGVDTELTSTRVELLRQCEQLRSGLPSPVKSLEEYYVTQLDRGLPPFVTDNPTVALDMSHSAIHTVSRIQVDIKNGTIRNEFRHIDSQMPLKVIQAFLLTLGLVNGIKELPSYEESLCNFTSSVAGIHAPMTWRKKKTTANVLGQYLGEIAIDSLRKQGFSIVITDILRSFLEELGSGESRVQRMRTSIQNDIKKGRSKESAFAQALQIQ